MSQCPMHNHTMPFDEEYLKNPIARYIQMHETGKSVHRICLPDGTPAWMVTGYDDLKKAFKDKRILRHPKHAGPDYANVKPILPDFMLTGNLAMEDPPEHTRLRRIINFAFTRQRVEALTPRIEEVTEALFARMAEREEVDIITDLAAPLPITIICEILGIPDQERDHFLTWTNELLGSDPQVARNGAEHIIAYSRAVFEAKQLHPTDDLISHWVNLKDEEGLTLQEMVGMIFLLLIGGFDTTVGVIGAAVLGLLAHPERAQELRDHPELINNAVEEFMRWDGSVHNGIRRFAGEDMMIGDTAITKGDCIILSISSGHYDPEHFTDPEQIDFHREDLEQLGFGLGAHVCPGKELARIELRIALLKLVQRFPNMKLAIDPSEVAWRPSYIIRTPLSVPIFTNAPAAIPA